MRKCCLIREKGSDIFPPLGVPLCALALKNVAFGTSEKSKGTLKK